jgi:PIN domain nuclease of toxin-antitoxin system
LRILLDTHIWLWIQDEPDRIGRSLRSELRNSENEIFLSPISTWEALVLLSKGRIKPRRSPSEWIARNTAPFQEAPLTHEIALVSQELSLTHPDPADRFLVATAKVLGLVLATADTKLLGIKDITTLANR